MAGKYCPVQISKRKSSVWGTPAAREEPAEDDGADEEAGDGRQLGRDQEAGQRGGGQQPDHAPAPELAGEREGPQGEQEGEEVTGQDGPVVERPGGPGDRSGP